MYYFDNAATSFPKPEKVYTKIMDIMRNCGANAGRGIHAKTLEASREIYKTRELLAELFHVDNPLNIVFTANSTESLNTAIKGVLASGDHVITSSIEHNSVLRPLEYLKSKGVEYTVLSYDYDTGIKLDELENKITVRTKAVIVNHSSNVTGQILPIEEIGRICFAKNILFIVDASQSAGVLDIDVVKQNIDILCFTGHKSLYGPQGTGGLYVKTGVEIVPLKHGGTGSNSEKLDQPRDMPAYLESGTLNVAGIAGLGSGLEWIKSIGREKIIAKERELREYFISKVEKNEKIKIYRGKSENSTGVVSINFQDIDSEEISYFLSDKFGISCRGGLHCAPLIHRSLGTINQGTVRFSFSYFNTFQEIDYLLDCLQKITQAS